MWLQTRMFLLTAALIGLGAFFLYFITNLLVLYGSRIREYYADQGSVRLGNMPHYLATALYKLVHGNARFRGGEELKRVGGAEPSSSMTPPGHGEKLESYLRLTGA